MCPRIVIISAIPFTAPLKTSFALSKALKIVSSPPYTSASFSLGITINESTHSLKAAIPSSACLVLLTPSYSYGFETTATVKIPASLAS